MAARAPWTAVGEGGGSGTARADKARGGADDEEPRCSRWCWSKAQTAAILLAAVVLALTVAWVVAVGVLAAERAAMSEREAAAALLEVDRAAAEAEARNAQTEW